MNVWYLVNECAWKAIVLKIGFFPSSSFVEARQTGPRGRNNCCRSLDECMWSREKQNDIGLQAIKTNKKGQIKTDIKSDNCPLYYGFRKHKIDADAREKEGN